MKVLRRDDDLDPTANRMGRILTRVGVAGVLAGGFVGAALLVEPSPSPAGPAGAIDEPVEPLTAPSPERVTLGTLEGLEHTLIIVATPDGPRYTALDPLGNPIAVDLPADEVYRVVPDADVDRMIAGPLMLADFD